MLALDSNTDVCWSAFNCGHLVEFQRFPSIAAFIEAIVCATGKTNSLYTVLLYYYPIFHRDCSLQKEIIQSEEINIFDIGQTVHLFVQMRKTVLNSKV